MFAAYILVSILLLNYLEFGESYLSDVVNLPADEASRLSKNIKGDSEYGEQDFENRFSSDEFLRSSEKDFRDDDEVDEIFLVRKKRSMSRRRSSSSRSSSSSSISRTSYGSSRNSKTRQRGNSQRARNSRRGSKSGDDDRNTSQEDKTSNSQERRNSFGGSSSGTHMKSKSRQASNPSRSRRPYHRKTTSHEATSWRSTGNRRKGSSRKNSGGNSWESSPPQETGTWAFEMYRKIADSGKKSNQVTHKDKSSSSTSNEKTQKFNKRIHRNTRITHSSSSSSSHHSAASPFKTFGIVFGVLIGVAVVFYVGYSSFYERVLTVDNVQVVAALQQNETLLGRLRRNPTQRTRPKIFVLF